MTGPEHYKMAESLIETADAVMDFEHGIYASMGTEERLERRVAITAEAQVHATLALAATTGLGAQGQPLDDQMAWLEAASEYKKAGQ